MNWSPGISHKLIFKGQDSPNELDELESELREKYGEDCRIVLKIEVEEDIT